MNWSKEKIIQHDHGILECRDCHIFVCTPDDFNLHDCELGMKQPKKTSPIHMPQLRGELISDEQKRLLER